MILFEQDFSEQGAIANTATKNLSFVKMALLLNQMGVKNNLFHLALYDRDLKNVDPHDLKDDSLELKERIAWEAKINPWFFLRELLRVTASGSGGVPYLLNRANLAQSWCFFNSINSFLVMPRQCGKTVNSMSLACDYLYIMGKNVQWGMFCKGIKLQNENVDRLKKLRDALPQWLLLQTTKDTNNKEGIAYDALQTALMTFVAQSDKQAAGDQARGQSLAVEHWDEVAFYDNIHLSYSVATAAMNAAAEQASASGLPTAVMMTTTAGDIDDPRGKWCYNHVCDALRFSEKLYDVKDRTALMDILRANSRNLFMYLEYNHKQLGKSDEWFERVTRGKDPRAIERDYLNMWTHGSDRSIVPKELMDKVLKSRRDPVAMTSYESLVIKWYDDPKLLMADEGLRNRPYVLGLDTSDNVGRDFTSGCMLDPYDLHTVATFKCNTTNLAFVARAVMDILVKFPRSIFIPERNKLGSMFIDFVFAETRRDLYDPLTRIYNMYNQKYTSDNPIGQLNYEDGEVRKNFGFTTSKSATSREFLYSTVLMTALKLVGDRLYDSSVIDEIAGITVRNGRVDHSEKGHDDLLIAFLLAAYFILYGANHHLYGISPDEFLSHVNNDTGDSMDPDMKRQQNEMKALLMDYKSKLKHCSNSIVRAGLEREIAKLASIVGDIPMAEDQIVSLEQAKRSAVKDGQKALGIPMNELVGFM